MLGGSKRGANGLIKIEELPDRIEEYFESCKPRAILDENGEKIWETKDKVRYTMNIPTINGLCRFLGYKSVSYMNTVMRHPNSPRAKILQDAWNRIAEFHESRLADGDNKGSMFWLQHAQKEIWGNEVSVTGTVVTGSVNLSASEEELFKKNLKLFMGNIANEQLDDEDDEDKEELDIRSADEAIDDGRYL
jgi:hypothetical protein